MKKAVSVFFAMIALDLAFGLYVANIASHHVLSAAAWAAAIQLCNSFVVVSYVRDIRMAIPCVLGAFAGTWVAVSLVS